MRGIWTVARRELRGYFDQPTAYVLIVAFLGVTLFLAFRTIYASGVASLRPIFDLLPILFAIFVPAATMRSLAEERRSKTLEWLLAQPLTETEVVAGKFLGNWLFVMLALAGTVPAALGVLAVSDADAGIMVAEYIGGGLLAAQFVAIGLWASSFTRNQITAFIVAAAVAFALFLIGLPIVQIGVPPVVAGWLGQLSVLSHFENVARGVVDLRDVVYFASTTALFLVLALGSIQRDRLSHGRPEWRRMRVGAAVVALLVLMVNLAGSYVRGRIDLTSGNLYTLEQGTSDLLGDLDDLVQVKLFASSELPPELQLQLRDVRDLLADMGRASNGNLVVSDVDPDGDEDAAEEASQLGIFPVEFNVLRDDQFEVRRGYYGLAVV
jgi:ABC-2 type transport system permease protein